MCLLIRNRTVFGLHFEARNWVPKLGLPDSKLLEKIPFRASLWDPKTGPQEWAVKRGKCAFNFAETRKACTTCLGRAGSAGCPQALLACRLLQGLQACRQPTDPAAVGLLQGSAGLLHQAAAGPAGLLQSPHACWSAGSAGCCSVTCRVCRTQ